MEKETLQIELRNFLPAISAISASFFPVYSNPTLLALPRLLKWNRKLRTLLSVAALGTLGYSLVTRYKLSMVKLLPMKSHLTLDFVNGATLAAAPFLLLDENERDATTTGLLIGPSAFEIAASLLTQTEPTAQAEKSVAEQARELVESKS